ncbi:MAG TPA: hypothetical protein O0X74_04970 [Methanocorpusculum sp.]|nr:hypothetical protein [Methanocorpusculum sp.]
MPETFPNQRMVKVHRERATANFLGIKNENWQAASRDLGAHGLQLYLYLASNADNYTLALSPAAVRQAIGLKRSTYHDKFHELEEKGYLVNTHGNTFEFYEVPQAAAQTKNSMTVDGLDFEEYPSSDTPICSNGQGMLSDNIEINNRDSMTDSSINKDNESARQMEQFIPKVKEVVIKRPKAEGKKRPTCNPKPKEEEFVF